MDLGLEIDTVQPASALKDNSDEINRKRLEKQLLVSFNCALNHMAEKRHSDGILILTELLKTKELNESLFPNSDYEKLKAACHLNLYYCFAELKETRKSFYFAIKYLEYEKDNYQLAFEFSCKLLHEGFISASIIYLKRSFTFAMAKSQIEFARLIFDKLIIALCVTDDTEHLRHVLENISKHRQMKGVDMSDHWTHYKALLFILGKPSEDVYLKESKFMLLVSELKSLRTKLKAKSEALKAESVALSSYDSCPQTQQEFFLSSTLRINAKSVTFNSILTKVMRQYEVNKKPIRRESMLEYVKANKNEVTDNASLFYKSLFQDVIVFENELKLRTELTSRESNESFNLIQILNQSNFGVESKMLVSYLVTLLSEINFDPLSAFSLSIQLSKPILNNCSPDRFSVLQSKFYQQLIDQCNGNTVIETLSMFITFNFEEKARVFATHFKTFTFFGPSLYLKEDFQLSAKEIFSLFNFLVSYVPTALDFGSFLVFLECYCALTPKVEFEFNLQSLHKHAFLLRKMRMNLTRTYFDSYANTYLQYLRQINHEMYSVQFIDNSSSTNYPCLIESCINLVSSSHFITFCDSCACQLFAMNNTHSNIYSVFVDQLINYIDQRVNWVFERICLKHKNISSDLPNIKDFRGNEGLGCSVSCIMNNDQITDNCAIIDATASNSNLKLIIRSNLAHIPNYWFSDNLLIVTTTNYRDLFTKLLESFTFNDIELLNVFVKLDFTLLSNQMKSISTSWKYLTELIIFIFKFIAKQQCSDLKTLEQLLESMICFFHLKEAIKFVWSELKSSSISFAHALNTDPEFNQQIMKIILFLFSNGSTQANECLLALIRLKLKIAWKTKNHATFFNFFLFISVYMDHAKVKSSPNNIIYSQKNRVRLLKCIIEVLKWFESHCDLPVNLTFKFKILMFLHESSRFIEAVYSIKSIPDQIFTYFLTLIREDSSKEVQSIFTNYNCQLLMNKSIYFSLESVESGSNSMNLEKSIVERYLLFRIVTTLNCCLTNFDTFLFCSKENGVAFSDNKSIGEKILRVHPVNDIRIPAMYFGKIEKICKRFESVVDLHSAVLKLLENDRIRTKYFNSEGTVDVLSSLTPFNYENNRILFLFLLITLRFQESSQIETNTKSIESLKESNYRFISRFYQYLKASNPFNEVSIVHFLEEAVSRSLMVADFSDNQTNESLSTNPSLDLTEDIENKVIHSLVNLHKIENELLLANKTNLQFPELVSNALVENLKQKKKVFQVFLSNVQSLVLRKGTKRIDYLLVFYFPRFLFFLTHFSQSYIIFKLKMLLHSLGRNCLESYHLNFKSGIDTKSDSKLDVVRVLAIARLLSCFYRTLFTGVSSSFLQDHIVAFETNNAHNIYNKQADFAPSSETKKATKDSSIHAYWKSEANDSDDIVIIENCKGNGSDTYHSVSRLYKELIENVPGKPSKFKELWIEVFRIIFDFLLKEKKSVSCMFHFILTETILVVKSTFRNTFDDSCYPIGFIDHLKRFEFSFRDKDFKINHADFTIIKNSMFYHSLVSVIDSNQLYIQVVQSSLKSIKRIEYRSFSLHPLNLLLPLLFAIESERSASLFDLIRVILENKNEFSRLMHNYPIVDYVWKFILKSCFIIVLNYIKHKIITEEEKNEIDDVSRLIVLHNSDKFDFDLILRNFKGVKANIRKYFEDKN